MPGYLIKHKATGERRGPVYASCADEACNIQGWELAACEAEELLDPQENEQPTCDGCEYQHCCTGDPQKFDYCPFSGKEA